MPEPTVSPDPDFKALSPGLPTYIGPNDVLIYIDDHQPQVRMEISQVGRWRYRLRRVQPDAKGDWWLGVEGPTVLGRRRAERRARRDLRRYLAEHSPTIAVIYPESDHV